MSLLELRDLRRSYERGREVLKGIDLRVEPGDVVGVVGRNGAGKTTLLRLALGLLRPDAGSVRVFGLDPLQQPVEVKRRVGYVSEDQVLPAYLRVEEVLALHRRLFPTWDPTLAADLIDRFALPLGTKISTLSKGQARQVAFLCAVAHHPELLLLDEPAGGLDPVARRTFLEAAVGRLSGDGCAIVFSSHHMTDVERIATRLLLLHEGEKLLDVPIELLQERATLAVLPPEVSHLEVESLPGVVRVRRRHDVAHVLFLLAPSEAEAALARRGWGGASVQRLSLEDCFIELTGDGV